jgi:hypothetical protein
MKISLLAAVLSSSVLVGCASIPMEDAEKSNLAKEYNAPSSDNAGLYVYRSGILGSALKKDVWVDDKCIGETAPNVFFYEELEGDKEHKISTESEFSPNDLLLFMEKGKNYFVRQYIKLGAFVGGAGVELVEEEQAKKDMQSVKMAKKGTCSQ